MFFNSLIFLIISPLNSFLPKFRLSRMIICVSDSKQESKDVERNSAMCFDVRFPHSSAILPV